MKVDEARVSPAPLIPVPPRLLRVAVSLDRVSPMLVTGAVALPIAWPCILSVPPASATDVVRVPCVPATVISLPMLPVPPLTTKAPSVSPAVVFVLLASTNELVTVSTPVAVGL